MLKTFQQQNIANPVKVRVDTQLYWRILGQPAQKRRYTTWQEPPGTLANLARGCCAPPKRYFQFREVGGGFMNMSPPTSKSVSSGVFVVDVRPPG